MSQKKQEKGGRLARAIRLGMAALPKEERDGIVDLVGGVRDKVRAVNGANRALRAGVRAAVRGEDVEAAADDAVGPFPGGDAADLAPDEVEVLGVRVVETKHCDDRDCPVCRQRRDEQRERVAKAEESNGD